MKNKTDRLVERLVNQLKVNDEKEIEHLKYPEEPKEAMDDLVRVGKQATEPLIRLLKNPEKCSCLYAIKVLGEIRDPRAAEPIVDVLDKFYDVFEDWDEPKIALWKIGLPSLKPLLNYFQRKRNANDQGGLIKVLDILAGIRHQESFSALISMLSCPDREMQSNVIWWLGEFGDRRAIKHLKKLLWRRELRDEAIATILKLETSPATEILGLSVDLPRLFPGYMVSEGETTQGKRAVDLKLSDKMGNNVFVEIRADKASTKGFDPKFDQPKPIDFWYQARVLVRLMPAMKDLVEVAVYLPADEVSKIVALTDKKERIEGGYAFRDRDRRATNIYLMQAT